MSGISSFAFGLGRGWPITVLALIVAGGSAGQADDPLRVQVEVGRGPYYVGQGFELRVRVIAFGQQPKIDPPQLDGAPSWTIGTEREPITATGIGSIVGAENLFVTRLRVVARRAGPLEVPSIKVRVRDRSGRSRPIRVPIEPLPPLERPADFLGGVGRFELHADATPKLVRVGRDVAFRIKVTGPAAWGMTGRPVLARFDQLPLGLRIQPESDETTGEPPARTFVYRLRPTRAGDAVLPPVAIAAFDPAVKRYVTHVTEGVPIRAVAVPAFDPATIDAGESTRSLNGMARSAFFTWGMSLALLLGAYAMLGIVRRRLRRGRLHGLTAARRYASSVARRLESVESRSGIDAALAPVGKAKMPAQSYRDAARTVTEDLIHYLRLGVGRPAGALTPNEASEGVVKMTGSQALAAQASELTMRCDRALYGVAHDERGLTEFLVSARALFEALGRVKITRRREP